VTAAARRPGLAARATAASKTTDADADKTPPSSLQDLIIEFGPGDAPIHCHRGADNHRAWFERNPGRCGDLPVGKGRGRGVASKRRLARYWLELTAGGSVLVGARARGE
jgi:hypothetical protein